ncbi:hypothetical protein RRG08_000226 [Elysia crispata]|uniref:Uncharacterized protein n=1 Tax=Elysia crispata TaxID=231223 RepID=A0AAE1AWL8_9GAST|nr:hypothetical protein RRG08_000226 [Elysia crispata]
MPEEAFLGDRGVPMCPPDTDLLENPPEGRVSGGDVKGAFARGGGNTPSDEIPREAGRSFDEQKSTPYPPSGMFPRGVETLARGFCQTGGGVSGGEWEVGFSPPQIGGILYLGNPPLGDGLQRPSPPWVLPGKGSPSSKAPREEGFKFPPRSLPVVGV